MAAVKALRNPATHEFSPHVTLAAKTTKEIVDDYINKTSSEAPNLSFTCSEFSLLQLDEEKREWNTIKTFTFKQ